MPDSSRTVNLPQYLKDCTVVLRFVEPVPHLWTYNFRGIVPSDELLAAGERDFYLQHVTQPHRINGKCASCGAIMVKIGKMEWRCHAIGCATEGRVQDVPLRRGVVDVLTFKDFVRYTQDGLDFVDTCIVVLDRRYAEPTLKGVRELCGIVAEIQGIRLLDVT